MVKIPTIFQRDESKPGHPIVNVPTPGTEWVHEGLANATAKLDGANVKIEGGMLFKRQKPKERDYDMASYVPCDRGAPADKWFWLAYDQTDFSKGVGGIYEAVGPHFQGNPHNLARDHLVRVVPFNHDLHFCEVAPLGFDALRAFFEGDDSLIYPAAELYAFPEGIVFAGDDGKLAKIKRRDFGLKWPL